MAQVRCRHPYNPDLIPTDGVRDRKGNWLVSPEVFCVLTAYGFIDADLPAVKLINSQRHVKSTLRLIKTPRPF